jgi:hypothetical protein
MKKTSSIVSRLKILFGTKSTTNVTFANHRDEYFRNYFVSEKVAEGIKWVARIERSTKKEAMNCC